jgi:hypothetical protein
MMLKRNFTNKEDKLQNLYYKRKYTVIGNRLGSCPKQLQVRILLLSIFNDEKSNKKNVSI